MSLDKLKSLDEVLTADERWQYLGRSLEAHHALVASFTVYECVPESVRQHFENARNAWLYSFFAYHLLSVALLALMVASEAAVKARALAEDLNLEKLVELHKHAIGNRWLTDAGFAAAADRDQHGRSSERCSLPLEHLT